MSILDYPDVPNLITLKSNHIKIEEPLQISENQRDGSMRRSQPTISGLNEEAKECRLSDQDMVVDTELSNKVCSPASVLSNCVTLGKSFHLFELQLPHL